MRHYILCILVSVAVIGCSSTPISTDEARGIPNLHVFQKDLMQPREDYAKVIFLRDAGLIGSPIFYNVFLDGRPLAAMDVGEQLVIWLKPGIYSFGVLTSESWQIVVPLWGTKSPSYFIRKFEMDARPDRQYNVRVGQSNGAFVFESVSSPKIH